MIVLRGRNVNHLLIQGIKLINEEGVETSPRGQRTLEAPEPVSSVYYLPTERVLLHPSRDANHFFHFFESIWILAGRYDVSYLAKFNSKIREYSDDSETFHGAYGYRLRVAFDIDQLDEVVSLLKKEGNTRRAVLQIWDASQDLNIDSKDIPCNDAIFLLIRNDCLYMTVCCRSNDILWGCYGANAVQFSVLQEYIAARVGVGIGTYTQISNSYHAYIEREDWTRVQISSVSVDDPYEREEITPYRMVISPSKFDQDLEAFMDNPDRTKYSNPFFLEVARPLWFGWKDHKKSKDGWKEVEKCQAPDWRLACLQWLERRGDGAEVQK